MTASDDDYMLQGIVLPPLTKTCCPTPENVVQVEGAISECCAQWTCLPMLMKDSELLPIV